MSRATALSAAETGAGDPFQLILSASKRTPGATRHLSGFLARCPAMPLQSAASALANATALHLSEEGSKVRTEARAGTFMPAVHVLRTTAAEGISVLLPVRNRKHEIQASIEAIRALRQRHRIDLHIIDMSSGDEAARRYLGKIRGQNEHVSRSTETLNVARALNQAAAGSRNRFLCFLEAGCVIDDKHWFEELVARCVPSDVAAAGPLLVAPSRVVLAAGLILDPQFGAVAAGAGSLAGDHFHMDLLRAARACSALPLAGLLVKRNEFNAVGGFDADCFGTKFHSVDLSLRLRQRRKRLILSPHAQLALSERSLGVPNMRPDDDSLVDLAELSALRARWKDALVTDACYSPALDTSSRPFSALRWPPGPPSLHASSREVG